MGVRSGIGVFGVACLIILYSVVDVYEAPSKKFWRGSLPAANPLMSPLDADVLGSSASLQNNSGSLAVLQSTSQGAATYQKSGPHHFERPISGGVVEHLHVGERRAELAWVFDALPEEVPALGFTLKNLEYRGRSVEGHHFKHRDDDSRWRVSFAFLVDAEHRTRPAPMAWNGNALELALASSDFDGLKFPVALDPIIEAEAAVGEPGTTYASGPQRDAKVALLQGQLQMGMSTAVAVWEDSRVAAVPAIHFSRLSLPEQRVEDIRGQQLVTLADSPDIACDAMVCAMVYRKTNAGLQVQLYDVAMDELVSLGVATPSLTAIAPRVEINASGAGLVVWTDSDGLHSRRFDLAGQSFDVSDVVLDTGVGGHTDIAVLGTRFNVTYGLGTDIMLYDIDTGGSLQNTTVLSSIALDVGALSLSSDGVDTMGVTFVDNGTSLSWFRFGASSLAALDAPLSILNGVNLNSPAIQMSAPDRALVSVVDDTLGTLLNVAIGMPVETVHASAATVVNNALSRGHDDSLIWVYDDGDNVMFRVVDANLLSVGEDNFYSLQGLTQHYVSLAGRAGEYMVVWTENDDNINTSIRYRGRRFAFDGSALDTEITEIFDFEDYAFQNTRDVAVAGPSGYLMMATPRLVGSGPSAYRVFHNSVWAPPINLPTPFAIHPRAASDGLRYLATWIFGTEVMLQFINADGSLSGESFSLPSTGGLSPKRASIAHNGSRYVVAFEANDVSDSNDRCLRSFSVENDGTVGTLNELTLCLDSRREIVPKLSAAGSLFLVSFVAQDIPGGALEIEYLRLDSSGAPLGANRVIRRTSSAFRAHGSDGISHALSGIENIGGFGKPSLSTLRGVESTDVRTWAAWSDGLEARHHSTPDLASDQVGRYLMAYTKIDDISPGVFEARLFLRGVQFEDGSDGDGVLEHVDNCPDISNTDQIDGDDDGLGDVCDGTVVIDGSIADGGDCLDVGTWDEPSQTCTLTQTLNSSLQIETPGVVLDCAGAEVNGDSAFAILVNDDAADVTISDCVLHAPGTGIRIDPGASNVVIQNTDFMNSAEDEKSILIKEADNVLIQNSSFDGGKGIVLNASNNITVSGSTFDTGVAIKIKNGSENVIVEDNSILGERGVVLKDATFGEIYSNSFLGNKGVVLIASSGMGIYENDFDSAVGIKIRDGSVENEILDNVFSGAKGVIVEDSDSNYIEDNDFNTEFALKLLGDSEENYFSANLYLGKAGACLGVALMDSTMVNYIEDNQFICSTSEGHGIKVLDLAQNNVVALNSFDGFLTGLLVNGTEANRFELNRFTGTDAALLAVNIRDGASGENDILLNDFLQTPPHVRSKIDINLGDESSEYLSTGATSLAHFGNYYGRSCGGPLFVSAEDTIGSGVVLDATPFYSALFELNAVPEDSACDPCDLDRDGYTALAGCPQPAGDCDDEDPEVNPGEADFTDGIDNNCSGVIDENAFCTNGGNSNGCNPGPADVDGDGVLDVVDNCLVFSNPSQSDVDGDGIGDACAIDFDGDGQLERTLAALNVNSYEGAKEICDGQDNNGDGRVDEGTRCEVCE